MPETKTDRLFEYCESLKAKINFLQQEVFDLRREVAALKERKDLKDETRS
jgi:hypothetical protein